MRERRQSAGTVKLQIEHRHVRHAHLRPKMSPGLSAVDAVPHADVRADDDGPADARADAREGAAAARVDVAPDSCSRGPRG